MTTKQVREIAEFIKNTETYKPVTTLKKVAAYTLIITGTATLPLPTGSIFAIATGCALLGIDFKVLMKKIKFSGRKLIDWIYGNRSLKLIKRNLKARFM
ncbi:MAG: hypothetical protein ACTSWD_04775 [Candidatus Heimdallarchaeota archaeon]